MTAKAPNILIVMADQMVPAFLPIYGHPVVRAPAMQALARDGVVFDSAYCASPLCAPSRASFMSGLLPSRTGVYDNAAEFAADLPTFAHARRLRGYRTLLSGKMHFCGPDQLHGFEQRLTTDIYPADFNWTPDWDRPADRPSWYHNMGSVRDAGLCVRSNQLDFDDEAAFMAERAIFDLARSRDRRPFLLVASFSHPYDPFAPPQPYWDLYRERGHRHAVSRKCARRSLSTAPPRLRYGRRAGEGSADARGAARLLRLDRLYRRTHRPTDGGPAVGCFGRGHNRRPDQRSRRDARRKMSFFEGACRVPLVVAAPGRFEPHRVAASVSLVDLMPTLVELSGGNAQSLGIGRRWTQPCSSAQRRRRTRRSVWRVSGRGCYGADRDDPPRPLQVHSFAR